MISFKSWLEINEARDQSGAAMQASSSAARDIGRNANDVIKCLLQKTKGWNIKLTPINSKEDVEDKVDGWFTDGPYQSKSVQIIRRIAARAKDDYAIQIVSKRYDDSEFFRTQLDELIKNFGSKLTAEAEIHIMLNADDDNIFLATIQDIRKAVFAAVDQMKYDPRFRGTFKFDRRSYVARNGVNIRIAQSKEGFSILAYVPAALVATENIPVKAEQLSDCEKPHVTQAIIPTNLVKTDMQIAADDAKEKGLGIIQIKSSNPKNISKKIQDIRKFALANNLLMKDKGDGTVSLEPRA
jgi:hypothetical protein